MQKYLGKKIEKMNKLEDVNIDNSYQHFFFFGVDARGQREKESFYESAIEKNTATTPEEIRVINAGPVPSTGTQHQ